MCGICGFISKDGTRADPLRLKRAADLIEHRGPDDEGFFVDGPVGLGMRRLSIIDLATGHQPISYADETLWIVFNGEIYNFLELRAELEAKGHRFKTRSDTEVILALYQDLGVECVKKLRGMFAFALWDKKSRRLLVARDRIGKKPLVYHDGPQGLSFASELRCLFALAPIPRDIDDTAVDEFLTLQYIPSPRTIYKAVRKLPPGHILVHEEGRTRVEPYWDLPLGAPPPTHDLEEAKRLLRDKLKESVKLRLIADVPLGAFLSGGIDSSIIVALMSQLSSKVRTFSIGFEESEFSELHYAREVAQRYGTDHTEFVVKAEMADVLPKIAWHYGEPYADASALPSYYVARETRKHVKVALNGDGGDENFAGYIRYAAMKGARVFDWVPGPLRHALRGAAELLPDGGAPRGLGWKAKRFLRSTAFADAPARHLKMVGYFAEDDKKGLYSPEFEARLGESRGEAVRWMEELFGRCRGKADFVNTLLYVDFKSYLPECLMTKIDIATMANSLEGRSPLLDHEFVELAFRLPGAWKLKGWDKKWILKETFKDLLPESIYKRGKMGFGIPLGPWFRGPLKGFWEEHCLSRGAIGRGYFTEAGLRRLWEEHQSGRNDHGYRLWALLMLELWHRHCLEAADAAPVARA